MAILRRLLALALALAVAVLLGVGVAHAQDDEDRPSVPPPSSGPALNVQTPDGQNDFQKSYEECTGDNPRGDQIIGDWLKDHVAPLRSLGNAIEAVDCSASASVDHPGEAFSTLATNATSAFWDDSVGRFAKAVMEGNVAAFSTVMTFWMAVPIPGLTTGDAVSGIRNITWEVQLVFLALGLIFAAAKLAIARHQAVGEGADETAKMLTRTIFASALLPVLVMVLHLAGDVFSTWVLNLVSDGDLNAKVTGIAWIDEKTGLGPVLALVLTGLGLFGSVVQLIALLVREAVLAVVVGIAPTIAATSATGAGGRSWGSIIGFVIAALAFKPVASLFYAFAFWASTSNEAASAVVGAVLIAVAGVAMPALVAAIGPVGTGHGGGHGQAAMMAGATGAMMASAATLGQRPTTSPASGSGGGGQGASGGAGGSPASGSTQPSYQGQYKGSSSGGGAGGSGSSGDSGTSGASGASSAGSGGGVRGALAAGGRHLGHAAGTATHAAGAVGRGAATVARATGQSTAAAANIAGGAVGNYHGQIPR